MSESQAYELEHSGGVHRASSFDVLLKWAEDLRVDGKDRFRPAGTHDWKQVTDDPRLAALLSPENHWRVRMSSGDFTAGSFEAVVRWAREGRLSTDAVIEGPKTPPGGVMASALPALAGQLKEADSDSDDLPRLRIDGIEYPAPDVETISRWITESRVPVDAEISLAGGIWEPVGSCGLFDLENWPQAALGEAEEPSGEPRPSDPEPPLPEPGESSVFPPAFTGRGELPDWFEKTRPPAEPEQKEEDSDGDSVESFTVITASGTEHSFEDPSEVLELLRKRKVMEYDEVRHSSLPEGSTSVGALADLMKRGRRRSGTGWWIAGAVLLAAAGVYFADTLGWITIPWLP
jgi:hypothetical protein